jgi:uncharacterized protein (TIGR03118 family)
VANADSSTSTIYNGSGVKLPLTVAVEGGPTGIVFNPTSGFQDGLTQTPLFIFDTEDGTIRAWAPALGPNSALMVDNSAADASYKGLALATDGSDPRLYAANFGAGTVDVFDTNYAPTLGGAFVDPTLADGYSPFNIQLLDGELYVTYALKEAGEDEETAGAGLGVVDVYDLQGNLIRRLASPGDELNAPWGLAIAPPSFREFAGALLVGNFGDGTISAFDRTSGAFLGKLLGTDGDPLAIDGLWSLVPGNDGLAGLSQRIYFTAGIDDETHGLFGDLRAVPEPAAWLLMLAGFGLAGAALRRTRLRAA